MVETSIKSAYVEEYVSLNVTDLYNLTRNATVRGVALLEWVLPCWRNSATMRLGIQVCKAQHKAQCRSCLFAAFWSIIDSTWNAEADKYLSCRPAWS